MRHDNPTATAIAILMLALSPACSQDTASGDAADLTDQPSKFMQMALDCVHRPYPNKIAHVFESDDDAGTPRQLHPVFYGCFDWHSSVHGHWLLVRLTRLNPGAELAPAARAALDTSFTEEGIAAEVEYLAGDKGYERPYGTAWLLQLTAELREWDDDDARRWLALLLPLEQAAVDQWLAWLPNLAYPIRLGTHNQTAFSFALALDWARTANHGELESILVEKIRAFHLDDKNCPLSYEPSGEDFLSPCLMEADLMRRVMDREEYATWLSSFLPEIPTDGDSGWLEPGIVYDPTDGKLGHLDGVNLSRAWNLVAMADHLPDDDPRRPSLIAASEVHARPGLDSVSDEHYEGGHWLASFATYLTSRRWALSD